MALYRKYRPATFAEVVGQEQVTTPLSAALDAGRINHAYLFSGPRGCGKTSSARIMARSLNCEHGPTSTPCGKCDSCVSLAPGGPGNLDVTELDAASHNGVEDMRELRDRAYYAPAESRYRIFIIDEAHMISPSGANALLKVVEEPPEHVIFIFATTEPEKIIGTIRSRTHHYPFRLLTPPAMKGLLQRTVASEGVQVEDAVYPMVIEAGGGSPRDTLSLLDQLLAGAGPDGLTYDLARPLLGVTDVTLLDDTIATLAENDKAGLFAQIDNVIEAGHDPRRFAVDLLDRLRDLMILQAVPDAIDAGLVSAPTDRAEVLTAQAQRFSGPQLTYLASTVNDRISDLTGATSPRLLLEIMCAHLLIGTSSSAAPGAALGAASQPGQLPQAAQPSGAPQSAQASQPNQAGQGAQSAQAAQSGQPGQSGQAAPSAGNGPAFSGAQDPQSAAAAIIARRRAKSQAQQNQPAPGSTAPAEPQQRQNQAATGPTGSEVPAQQSNQAAAGTEAQGTQSTSPSPSSQPEATVQQSRAEHEGAAQSAQATPDEQSAQPAPAAQHEQPAQTESTGAENQGRSELSQEQPSAEHAQSAQADWAGRPEQQSTDSQSSDVPEKDASPAGAGDDVKTDDGADPWGQARQVPQNASARGNGQAEPLEKPVPAATAQSERQSQTQAAQAPAQPEGQQQDHGEQQQAQGASASGDDGDFVDAVKRKWVELRGSVGKRNKVAEIMLAEARVLGFRDNTLTLGHTTGALAERINAPANNSVIVDVLREEFQRDIEVNCVVGTDPKTAGFDAPQAPQAKPEWNPNAPEREPSDDKEAESKPGWRSRIAKASEVAKQRDEEFARTPQFSNGVPLPPEPEGPADEPPPEEPPAYTRDDEERDMVEAAQSAGEMDHRSATEVAMELVEKELGARRV
ncbi:MULTISPECIES: DNA polymerase III subunit gamma and tau [Corynebacterium]|uniref:DNA polymerase III subunit gamma and tau n=1 Tax=Corynebacterium TaxID=1716 RepID=UPI00040F1E98|nr:MULTISPECIES: DNA polymerase III subunit gamma and tau [Corynebacterium]MCT1410524.1 DNA polymerase III subunit gamma and tau [Corynebacterium accolens]MDK4245578.1 DNA polymerase III subunit gamma and tau [Corynebacterium accolens]MDK4260582.1 DNA polymerase III subunit gamma and tau [Corynebacterium accolens]MDK4261282.1 DNA polymerase III subunit gamma and tau [Corynebacterium accolens]MDK4271636.1 DNA polymerase III subunit gamma and tau [Corynebacterium accolens]